jgi:hypothetical protein
MDQWLRDLSIDKPVIGPLDLSNALRNNLPIVIVCCIAVILHLRPIFLPMLIIGDENIHLYNGLWIYEFIDSNWHSLFQIICWIFICLLAVIRIKRDSFGNVFLALSNINWKIPALIVLIVLTGYFFLLKDIPYLPSAVRYPPVSKFLYFMTYSAFGIDRVFPRIVQLIFYLLCAVYLYRTINLFHEKETALLGASIYLFLPVSFAYAHLGELIHGTVFFVIAASFYFIRFLKDSDNRDLVITAYLIGIGFLYKKPALLVVIVCFIFLVVHKIKTRELNSSIYLKVLTLSLVPVIPWSIISKYFSWRNYSFYLSNFISPEGKLFQYILLVQSNISEILFILFVLSALYICFFRRNTLTVFFGSVFIVYYFFMVSDMAALSPRFSITFYPTIAVFLSVSCAHIFEKIKWRHALRLCSVVLISYLIVICSVPSLNKKYLHIMDRKLIYYPSEKAMKWVKENVKDGEKILIMRILSSGFYSTKYDIDRDRIMELRYSIEEVDTPEKLIEYYKKHGLAYIMFPSRPELLETAPEFWMLDYLKDNPDNEFAEVMKFSLDDHIVYIYKMREI